MNESWIGQAVQHKMWNNITKKVKNKDQSKKLILVKGDKKVLSLFEEIHFGVL